MYLHGLNGPVFYDPQHNPIDKIICGTPYTFDVPGYSQVYLEQARNGVSSYSGLFSVPMPSYVADCVRDVGTYMNSVYTVVNGGKGAFIGSVPFIVLPSQSVPASQPPLIQQTLAPGYQPSTVTSSGARILTTGVSTPSAPTVISVPGGGGGMMVLPAEPAEQGSVEEAGLNPWMMAALGIGLFFVMSKKGKG
jgi:hypothetical protein